MSLVNSAIARSVTAPLAAVLPKDGAVATHALLINGGIGTSIDSMRPLAEKLASKGDTAVYLLETPLAAADAREGVNNIEAMHRLMAQEHSNAQLAFMGESAGGNAMLAWDAKHNTGANRAPVLITPVSALTTPQAFSPVDLAKGFGSVVDRTRVGAMQVISPDGKGVPLSNNPLSPYFHNAPDASKTINASVIGDSVVNLVKGVRAHDRSNVTFLEPGDDKLAFRGVGHAYSHLFRGAEYVKIPGAAHAMTQEWQRGVEIDSVIRNWMQAGHAQAVGS